MKPTWPYLSLWLTMSGAAYGPPAEAAKKTPPAPARAAPVETASGLRYEDLRPGTGARPRPGQLVTVHYVGTLKDGQVFDSSLERGQPLRFVLGMNQVIAGWEEGLRTMRVGGKRRLVIPPALGYGSQAVGPIPPDSELTFVIELLAAE